MALFRYTWRSFAREIMVLAMAAVVLFPIYLIAVLALGSNNSTSLHPIGPPTQITTGNFTAAWQGSAGVTIGRGLMNSAIITVGTVLLLLIVGSVCAYALARRTSKLSTALYLVFVSGLIIPFQLGIIPVYQVMRHLHLVGTYPGMILLETGLLLPLTVFFYTGFIRALPRDYEEAAHVDGAGLFRTYFRVVFPLLLPVTGTVAVLTAVITWNDFFNPLVFLSGTNKVTVPVLLSNMADEFPGEWNIIGASVAIISMPMIVFYLFAQRQLIRGFSGGIRG